MPYQYNPLRNKLFVTIREYNRAYKLCELPENADPRPMLAIIARFMEANNHVGGIVRSAHDDVTGFPWDIKPSDEENTAAVKIAAETKERFIQSGLHHEMDVMMDGEFHGLTGLRQVWANVAGKMRATISVIPSTDLYFKKDENGIYQVVLIKDETTFGVEAILPEQRQQYIFSHFNPYKSTRPGFIGGLCRSAVPLTVIKNFTWQDWAEFSEIYGQPLRTAEYKTGTSNEDKTAAKEALEDFGKNTWALVSENIKFQLLEAARSGNVDAYQKLQESIDKELAILIKGEANTQQLPANGGSRAALQILKLISDNRMWWRLKRLEEIINEQYIAVDCRLNVSESDITLRPKFEFLTDEIDDREANARIVTDLVSSGYTLDDNEVSQKTGFTVTRAAANNPPPPLGGGVTTGSPS